MVQSSTGASSETGGQPAALQPRTQPIGMSAGENTVVQGQTTGSRTAVSRRGAIPVDASRNAAQGVECPPEPVLPMEVDRNSQAGDHMPTWWVLLPANRPEFQVAGCHRVYTEAPDYG